ncbi:hypothetical protein [Cohnella hashimotonis]|uniref:Uncharacterized protein n=1 Tax=Cohnella hashimotonis TaxID=2826895 RepID=A0ABT6TIV5_9BACL|nr:hypothetical protein [Cohnella hashimotonis]MDI4646655.1 hypothetical protein [Cohnella hashimotonis]
MKIHGANLPPALSPLTVNHSAFQFRRLADAAATPLAVSISDAGSIKSDYLVRFRKAMEGEDNSASYLSSYAETYGQIRQELLSGGTADPSQALKLLDEVYGEVTGEAADRLTARFDAFFGGASGRLEAYGMSANPSGFDREAFRKHLADLAEEAKRIVLEHPGETAAGLENAGSGETLESMGYRDIKALSGALSALGSIEPPVSAGGNPSKLGAAVAAWETAARRVLTAAGLSDQVKDAAFKAVQDQSRAKLKTGAYTQAADSYRNKIDETLKKLAHLAFLIATINGKLETLKGLDPSDPRIQNLLRREQELEKGRADYASELKSHKENLRKLEKDPDSVEGSEAYRLAKSAYDEAAPGKSEPAD